ncbi:rCG54663 [Rattus norvegicus]|uniref:RCG54663 n=1 Tax=Rattus norvegicus TaxID=10116 RepID=A6KFJ5_RAT|nr:rCG54663 [Rattus norvegicus]
MCCVPPFLNLCECANCMCVYRRFWEIVLRSLYFQCVCTLS